MLGLISIKCVVAPVGITLNSAFTTKDLCRACAYFLWFFSWLWNNRLKGQHHKGSEIIGWKVKILLHSVANQMLPGGMKGVASFYCLLLWSSYWYSRSSLWTWVFHLDIHINSDSLSSTPQIYLKPSKPVDYFFNGGTQTQDTVAPLTVGLSDTKLSAFQKHSPVVNLKFYCGYLLLGLCFHGCGHGFVFYMVTDLL